MKKEVLLLFTTLLLGAAGCNNEKELKDNNTLDILPETKHTKTLAIDGDNIWVRNTPKKGEVVMKLSTGDQCTVLDTSEVDTIRGFADYWYQISFKEDTGWVFGSQTSIKSENSRQTDLFLKRMKDFVYALDKEDFEMLNSFIYPGDSIHCVQSGQGVYPIIVTVTDFAEFNNKEYSLYYFLEEFKAPSPDAYQVDYDKTIDVCDDIIGLGFSYKLENKYRHISGTQQGLNKYIYMNDITDKEREALNRIREREKQVSFEFTVATIYPVVDFYFYVKQGRWYLLGITSNDCSA